MIKIINWIPYKKIRIFLKDYLFSRAVYEELLDKVDHDIIRITQEKSLSSYNQAYSVLGENPDDRLAIKRAVKENLLRKAQPSVFLTSFVYPCLVALVTTVVTLIISRYIFPN